MRKVQTNIREIALAAGVSTASVSRALRGLPGQSMSSELRERILRICAQKHYVPNAHTKRIFSHRANTVAILFPPREAISSDFHGQMVDFNLTNCMMGAQEYLARQGIGLLLNELSADYLAKKSYLQIVRSQEVDGVLVWGARENQDWFSELRNENVPMVLLQTYLATYPCVHVIADDESGMRGLMEAVLASGHRRIGYAPAPESASTGRLRNEAFRRVLEEHGLAPVIEYSHQGYGFEFGYEAGKALLAQEPALTCIVNSNDMAAWGCIKAIREMGKRVPEDLSVVGCDGLSLPFDVRISSYYLPAVDIGRRGAELLLTMINGQKVPEETVLPVQTIQGNTLAALRGCKP